MKIGKNLNNSSLTVQVADNDINYKSVYRYVPSDISKVETVFKGFEFVLCSRICLDIFITANNHGSGDGLIWLWGVWISKYI